MGSDNAISRPPTAIDVSASDPYADRAGRQWRLVTCLMLLAMLGSLDRQILSLLINPMKADLGITDTQISLIYGAAFAITYLTFTLPAGYLADRVSRRGLITVGALAWSGMTVMCGSVASFGGLLLTRAGVGMGEAVIQPCGLSMLRSALPEKRRGKGFAVYGMAGMTGGALALLFGGPLYDVLADSGINHIPLFGAVSTWQLTFILVGLGGLPICLLMALVPEPGRPKAARANIAADVGAGFAYIGRRWKVYAPLIGFATGYQMAALAFGAWVVPMIGRNFELSMAQIGTTMGILFLLAPPIGFIASGILIDRCNARFGLAGVAALGVIFIALYCVGVIASPLMPTFLSFLVVFTYALLVSGTPAPIVNTLLAAVTPADMMGKIAAVQLFISGLASTAIGPTIVAAVSDGLFEGDRALAKALSLTAGVYSVAAILFLGLVYLVLKRRGQTNHEDGLA